MSDEDLRALLEELRSKVAAMKAQLDRIEKGYPLYVNEKEAARRLGISEARWRKAKRILEPQGLPKIDPLIGLRYWQAVAAFFERRHGLSDKHQPPVRGSKPDWKENLDAL